MNLNNLIDRLNSHDEAERLYAAEDLGACMSPAAVAGLARRLSAEPSRAVKEAIFHALGRISDDSVMPTAVGLIDSDDAFVRNEAVRLLGTRGARAMPALVRAIASEDRGVRKFALDAMAAIDSDLKEEIYRKALGDEDLNVVITAVEYIGRDNRTALRESVEIVLEKASHPMLISVCVEALGRIGNAGSLDAMYRKLGGDKISRFQAPGFMRAVGYLGTDAHVELLCRLVDRFSATFADAGLDAIEAIRCRVRLAQAPPALLTAVQSIVAECSDPLACYKAVLALGAFTDDAARDSIRRYLESPDKMLRLAAVESIARWDAAAARSLLARRQGIEPDEDVLAAIEDAARQQPRNAA